MVAKYIKKTITFVQLGMCKKMGFQLQYILQASKVQRNVRVTMRYPLSVTFQDLLTEQFLHDGVQESDKFFDVDLPEYHGLSICLEGKSDDRNCFYLFNSQFSEECQYEHVMTVEEEEEEVSDAETYVQSPNIEDNPVAGLNEILAAVEFENVEEMTTDTMLRRNIKDAFQVHGTKYFTQFIRYENCETVEAETPWLSWISLDYGVGESIHNIRFRIPQQILVQSAYIQKDRKAVVLLDPKFRSNIGPHQSFLLFGDGTTHREIFITVPSKFTQFLETPIQLQFASFYFSNFCREKIRNHIRPRLLLDHQ